MSAICANSIYLDHNATTPILPEVVEAMCVCWSGPYFNPASQHQFGRHARRLLENARERIGELLGAHVGGTSTDQVIFTSGGTESNNLAVLGLAHGASSGDLVDAPPRHPAHIVISSIEHPSISALADQMSTNGWSVSRLGVDGRGVTLVDELAGSLRPETQLVALTLGQNETGVLQPVAEAAAICARHGVPLHTDAAQVVGKVAVDFYSLGAATMTVAAHKFHGPLGVGVLVVRDGTRLHPQLYGGFQQAGLRPGTESVPLAVGMCRALELWHSEREGRTRRLRTLRDRLEGLITAGWPGAVVIGARAERLPHVSHIALVGLERQSLFMALDQAGVASSTGSACASGSSEPSPILVAMGCEKGVIDSALRFSLGATTTDADVDEAARRILHCCNDLRRQKHG
jgi:cysteine desulfurase